MMSLDWKLFVLLLGALALMQGVCWLLARGLGRRLERHVMILGVLLPVLFLVPWLDRSRLLVPCDILVPSLPGAPEIQGDMRHELLNDLMFQLLPWELEVRRALGDRRLPLWSDALDGGSSPWVNPQAGVLSAIALMARAFPVQHHLLAMLALKILVGFEGIWLLARTAGARRASSLLAAAGLALGGGMMAWGLFPPTAVLAWVPWLAAGTILLFRKSGTARIAIVAVLTALVLLSGHPETAAAGGLFAAVCGLSLRSRRRPFVRGLGAAMAAAGLGLALAAPQLLPFALHVKGSQRAHDTLTREMPAHSFHVSYPQSWFLPGYAAFMLTPTNPRIFGRPYREAFHGPFSQPDADSGYTGLVAFAGAWIALLAGRRRRAWPFLAFALVGLLLAAQALPLAHLIFAVRPLRAFAYGRFLSVVCLALAVAGALGIDALRNRRRLWTAVLALAAAAALSLWLHAETWVAALWVLLLAAAMLTLRWPRLGTAALGAVLLLDLVPWAWDHLPEGQPALFYPRTAAIEQLVEETGRGGPWRATAEGYAVFASLLPAYGIDEVRPHNPVTPLSYQRTLAAAFGYNPSIYDYFGRMENIDHPFLDFLNVRAVVSTAAQAPPRTLERIDGGRFGGYRIYRNPDALPRWFIPAGTDAINLESAADWISSLRDPWRVAVFRGSATAWTGRMHPGRVELVSGVPGSLRLRVHATGETLLATSLPQPEGWRATAGGQRLETLPVNGAFLGVRVPAGAREVELRFVPPGLLAGTVLAVLAVFGIAVLAFLTARGSSTPPASSGSFPE